MSPAADAAAEAGPTNGSTNQPPGEAVVEEATIRPDGSGLADFPERLAEKTDFERALASIEDRLEEVRSMRAQAESAAVPTEERSLHEARIDALEQLKLIVQRHQTQQARYEDITEALAQQQAEEEGSEGGEDVVEDGPLPLQALDETRTERELLERERDAMDVSLEAIQEKIKAAEAELFAAQKKRREARVEQERTASDAAAPDEAAAAAFELARLREISATYRLETLRTQQLVAEKRRQRLEARLDALIRQIRGMAPRVEFSAETLDRRRDELTAEGEELREQLEELRSKRDDWETRLYQARQDLAGADGEDGERAAVSARVAAWEAQVEAANRGIEYLEKQLEYLERRRELWERRYAMSREAEDVDAADWLSDTREALDGLARDRDMVEARLNAVRKAQLDLQNRLDQPDGAGGDPEVVRQRLSALEMEEGFGRDMLAAITAAESVAERLRQQLAEAVKLRDLGVLWDELIKGLIAVWRYELFVVQDEVVVNGRTIEEDRGFTVGRTVILAAAFLAALAAAAMAGRVLDRAVLPRLVGDARHPRDLSRDVVGAVIRNTNRLVVVVIALWMASRTLPWRGLLHGFLDGALTVALWIQLGLWANAVLGRVLQRNRLRREEADPASLSAYGLLGFFGRVAIWLIIALSVLWALDYQIAPLIGALGVGGIAVAFALQSILADIFNSMAIILDKPFRVGDFVIVGETLGVVEQIGIKTTRIRSLSGEQTILTNSDLLGSRIRNFKRMLERRVAFTFGVIYQTPARQLERIPAMVREIIEGIERTRFDRAHFFQYGDFSLNFEVVYYVSGSDYNLYMDIQQAINLGIYRRFEEEGIEFAYPTQSVILQRSGPAATNLQEPLMNR